MKVRHIGVVSLSSGVLGEDFLRHEPGIGEARLAAYGVKVTYLPHARAGIDYIKAHPEKRAADLLLALRDPDIDMVLCAIGGDDTYRLLPHLFAHGELAAAACDKIFLGFSDTTINHLMLHKVGMCSFYGQAFLPDICEIGPAMPAYSRGYFEELIRTGGIRQVVPSPVWYETRKDFSAGQVGVPLIEHPDTGWELLQGAPIFSGRVLGGCIDSLYDIFDGARYPDMPALCRQYRLFPDREDWRGRILLLETSEEYMPPAKYRQALIYLKRAGVFDAVSGVLVGKPMDGVHEQAYKQALVEVIDRPDLPVLCNLNIGHAMPRCILPFGVTAHVDAARQVIRFEDM